MRKKYKLRSVNATLAGIHSRIISSRLMRQRIPHKTTLSIVCAHLRREPDTVDIPLDDIPDSKNWPRFASEHVTLMFGLIDRTYARRCLALSRHTPEASYVVVPNRRVLVVILSSFSES